MSSPHPVASSLIQTDSSTMHSNPSTPSHPPHPFSHCTTSRNPRIQFPAKLIPPKNSIHPIHSPSTYSPSLPSPTPTVRHNRKPKLPLPEAQARQPRLSPKTRRFPEDVSDPTTNPPPTRLRPNRKYVKTAGPHRHTEGKAEKGP